MSSSAAVETEAEAPDLVCELDSVQGIVDALTSVRWKRHQLFVKYDYKAHGRPRFGASLGLFVDCLNTFSVPGRSNILELRYPGPDMQLLLRSVDSPDACIYAEIRTRIPETISWDYNFEPAGSTPLIKQNFENSGFLELQVAKHGAACYHSISCNLGCVQGMLSCMQTLLARPSRVLDLLRRIPSMLRANEPATALKEAIDDLEWPGSSIQIKLQPTPPSVIFKGEGHGDLQIDFNYYANTDLLIAFSCDRQISHRFINFHLACHATTTLPSASTDFANHSHLFHIPHVDSAGYQQPSRIAYIEFFVKPEVEDESVNDS
ncbi:hypothetical protein DH2020_046759 [Rehmannia glutinosa]|uniref:Uncharacterized protein n=1 Tax=Rehmannia glutinosa TaxID=99300 RepID=A0ABR0UAI4_REHGL